MDSKTEFFNLSIEIDLGIKSVQDQSIHQALGDGADRDMIQYMKGITQGLEEEENHSYAAEFRTAVSRLKKFAKFLGKPTLSFGDFSIH